MARLYANESFPQPVVVLLRRLGHDVLTMGEAGAAGRAVPDEDVLALARAEGRAVLTLNRKQFVHLHGAQPFHTGVVVCTVDADFEGQAHRIDSAIRSYPDLSGQLVRVNRPAS